MIWLFWIVGIIVVLALIGKYGRNTPPTCDFNAQGPCPRCGETHYGPRW